MLLSLLLSLYISNLRWYVEEAGCCCGGVKTQSGGGNRYKSNIDRIKSAAQSIVDKMFVEVVVVVVV